MRQCCIRVPRSVAEDGRRRGPHAVSQALSRLSKPESRERSPAGASAILVPPVPLTPQAEHLRVSQVGQGAGRAGPGSGAVRQEEDDGFRQAVCAAVAKP